MVLLPTLSGFPVIPLCTSFIGSDSPALRYGRALSGLLLRVGFLAVDGDGGRELGADISLEDSCRTSGL
jgi:hypothetical protein